MFVSLLGTVNAQDLNTQMKKANEAWAAGKYAENQAIFENIVKVYGPRAPMLYGPRFGVMHYRKGLSELKLSNLSKRANNPEDAAKWAGKAAESFSICYEKFPTGAKGMAKTKNAAHKASLQRWAEACMGLGDYKKANDLYKKYLKEPGKDKMLPTPGGFRVNRAICNFLMQDANIEEGIRLFETALKNKVKMQTTEGSIVAGFLALSQAVIAKKNEQAMVDFLNKNRSDLSLEPYKMLEFTPVFLKLAGSALKAKMYVAAFALYAMIPSSDDIIQDIKVRIAQLGDRPGIKDGQNIIELDRLKADLKKIKKRQSDGISHDAQILSAMAFLHNGVGNQRGVYGAFDQLERYYKKSKKREGNLFNLVRVSSLIGDIASTTEYGNRYMKAFPESANIESVRRLMLSTLFFTGKYKDSLALSESVIDTLEPGSEQHDMCLFVRGGSHFYLGNYAEAKEFLDQHVADYPESKFNKHSEYFQASNLTRLQEWDEAASQLEAFIEKYPGSAENMYLSNALFDLASCHYSNGKYPEAMTIIERIETDFADSAVVNMSYNMRGNILESESNPEEAEKNYKLALEGAQNRGQKLVAAEALSYLVGMYGAPSQDKKPNPRMKEAVPYYDIFMKNYPDAPYRPQVTIFGISAMQDVGRGDEGLKNLQDTITGLAAKENPRYLEESINAYSDAFLLKKGNTPRMLKDIYYSFPGVAEDNQRVHALLRIAIIGVYEDLIKDALVNKDEDAQMRYDAGIKVLFKDLKGKFNPADLSNSALIRIGDYLREKTSAPEQSTPYYKEILNRDDKTGAVKARLGIADVKGRSDSVADNKEAVAQLAEVVKLSKDDRETEEKALFRLVEVNAKIGDWAGCEKSARQYLDGKHTKKAAIVSYLFAQSFDKRKMVDDALANYASVYARYTGYLAISAPSVKRVMELLWERDLKAGAVVGKMTLEVDDRQNAYSGIGAKYIESTRRIRETNNKITEEEIAAWDAVAALVKQYEGSGQVKTVEQLKEERLKNRRGR